MARPLRFFFLLPCLRYLQKQGLFDELLNPDHIRPASPSSSGYQSIALGEESNTTTAVAEDSSSGYQSLALGEEPIITTESGAASGDTRSTAQEQSFNEDSETSSESEEDEERESKVELQGECAIDLFIDPINPFGKATHSSLQSKIIKQKQNHAEKRAEEIRKHKQEREMKKLLRQLENIKAQKEASLIKKDDLDIRLKDVKLKEDAYNKRFNAWKAKMDEKYNEELQLTEPLENSCSELREKLSRKQDVRMGAFKAKVDPIIIIKDAPSKKANYKMQAKYLQYEIYPLSQRFRISQMRADGEEMKRRRMQKEVWQLRDKISDYNAKISVATKGVPISKTMLSKIGDHKKRWKKLCNTVLIAKALALNTNKTK